MFRGASVCACGAHGFVGLTKGRAALVDPEAIPALSEIKWSLNATNGSRFGYAGASVKVDGSKRYVMMHRIVSNAPDGMVVDHTNGDTLDNRSQNLRVCTAAQNRRNNKPTRGAASNYIGVHKGKNGWDFQVAVMGQRIRGYSFPTEEAAAIARDNAAIIHHGEFAKTNGQVFGLGVDHGPARYE